jgi:hypothetical protein
MREESDRKFFKPESTERLIFDLHSRYRLCGKVKLSVRGGGDFGLMSSL